MNLQHLLQRVNLITSVGILNREVTGIAHDHRGVQPGYAFVCYEGVKVDGHAFIPQAIQNGASVLLGEKPPPTDLPTSVTYLQVPNGRTALSLIAANWYGNPANRLKLIGITGTNGKTSTTYLAHSIFNAAGLKSAIIGTVSYRYGDVLIPASTTTPESLKLHELFGKVADAGLDYIIMETSSQGLAQHRLAGLTFETAVFTNLTQDHLDYHQTMENYLNAKLMLFQQLNSTDGLAILNADDPASDRIRQQTRAPILTYGVEKSPPPPFSAGLSLSKPKGGRGDLTVRDVESKLTGLAFTAITPQGELRVGLRLLGDYNLYNALAAIGVGLHHGCSLEAIKAGLESTIVPGRFELVDRGQDFAVVVDYAHTPDGLENLLTAARKITNGRLICVFGCGGDRDRGKRPIMGKISTTIADHTVITSDNPRTEDPDRIIADIVAGLPDGASYDVLPNRKEAIGYAIGLAKGGDLVAIAGKGHEPYQEIHGVRSHFDDREVAAEFLERIDKSARER
ncbi:UDP-N-acetylmuramoyl-L-alanyl-D-glutamate--2,6-diaminopimelate ligase [Candidatus Poribacteria bacterium]|nr:UDP-N-acetylmuramoyl-L-alanyl-D-glutamate--2,6-diaminopimelate ligase [Candidatus Poribacteria bacterium]